MFRRQLGKHATLRVDDERSQGGDGWTHSGRGILNQAPAPCRAVVSPDPGGSGAGEADGRCATKPSGGFQQSIAGQTVSADPDVRLRP